jgi:uncharacterized phage-associated protein
MTQDDQSQIRHRASDRIDTFRGDASVREVPAVPQSAVSANKTDLTGPTGQLTRHPGRYYRAAVTTSAHAITAALHLRRTGLGASKAQNLLFFCQGHHLADLDEPLFNEPIWAVAGGVHVDDMTADGDDGALSGELLATVDRVIARYGDLGAAELRTLIWASEPWKLAAARPDDPRVEWMWLQDWFRLLAADPDDTPLLSRDQLAALAERARTEPAEPGAPDSRARIQARLDDARRRASRAP